MIEMTTTKQAEQAVRHAAEEHGLNPTKFANFWNNRFGHYAPAYAREWAERINTGCAHALADNATRDPLEQAGFSGGQ